MSVSRLGDRGHWRCAQPTVTAAFLGALPPARPADGSPSMIALVGLACARPQSAVLVQSCKLTRQNEKSLSRSPLATVDGTGNPSYSATDGRIARKHEACA